MIVSRFVSGWTLTNFSCKLSLIKNTSIIEVVDDDDDGHRTENDELIIFDNLNEKALTTIPRGLKCEIRCNSYS
jgi:NhaP-type Na+/H+ and K+/H+ antiporter